MLSLKLVTFLQAVMVTRQDVISIAQGLLRGFAGEGYVSYTGIPYANVTSATARYTKAGLAPLWTDIRESRTASCKSDSEPQDCLLLDVHAPAAVGANWPVLVWVTGGSGPYHPGKMVQEGIIVVIVYHRDAYFISHIHRSVRLHVASAPVFYYQFSFTGKWGVQPEPGLQKRGAAHSDELAYLFYDGNLEGEDGVMQRRLLKLWTNFVKHLNPSYQSDVSWEPSRPDNYRLLDIGADVKMIDYPHSKVMQMWDDIYEKYYYTRNLIVKTSEELRCNVRLRIESGWVCGLIRLAEDGREYASFRGVPYAQQPVGQLRFKELQPARPWPHLLDATEEGPICPQHDEIYENLIEPHRGINGTNPDDIHDALIKTPLEDILRANTRIQYDFGLVSFLPVVEPQYPGVTRILDDTPTNLMIKGRGNELPFLVGFADQECDYFRRRLEYLKILSRIEKNPLLVLPARIPFSTLPNVALQLAEKVIKRYFHEKPNIHDYLEICRDTFFEYPSFKMGQLRDEMKAAPLYLYQFRYVSDYSVIKAGLRLQYKGTTHVEDQTFVLKDNVILGGDKALQRSDRDNLMQELMTSFVVNFIQCNDPTCDVKSGWRPLRAGDLNYLDINDPVRLHNTLPTHDQKDMIEFLDGIESIARNFSIRATSELLPS
ncbi:unnamed protein product [Chrysodeixis includens]|uniref:Carboxylesterase type B domain-containing protein n=1 Tax=Chrysodeixis includens TaxID=689277 RepID=A0A9N8PZJ2_CHRIL|nr:unnamed protein product [Chrysodeixis includens]